MPKTNFSPRGITIRSLSRYLGLTYEAVDVTWKDAAPGASKRRRDYNIVLLPWPLSVQAQDFRPTAPARIENMDRNLFGFFEFAPQNSLDCELVGALLADAGRVDAVILPESAVDAACARSSSHAEQQPFCCTRPSRAPRYGRQTAAATRTCRSSA